jgi:hypothetical protein
MIQIDEDKKGPPKPDAKQGDAQGYIPKSTITAFNCLSQEIKRQQCHIICSRLSGLMDMSRENGMKEMFCPCL